MADQQRRAVDKRRRDRHRTWNELHTHEAGTDHIRCPSRRDQLIQFAARYAFCLIGVLFFQFADVTETAWLSVTQMNLALGLYFLFNTSMLIHAWNYTYSPLRFRVAMLVDILITSICFLNDPNITPPTLAVYIMVVLGNGIRYGGDEFVLILDHTNLDHAATVAKRIRSRVSRYARDEELPCNISIGMGEAPLHGLNLVEMLDHVDQAMYRVKPQEKERREFTSVGAPVNILSATGEPDLTSIFSDRRSRSL